jgi:hypothetical protein
LPLTIPSESAYLHSKFRGKTQETIKEAIRAYGRIRENIEGYLSGESEGQP